MEHFNYLENQFLNEHTADVYFIIHQFKIPAHKVILAASSSLLEKRFNENIDLKQIEINSVSPPAFKEFLFAFYSKYPEKSFTAANSYSILSLAKAFGAHFCLNAQEKFLIKNLSTEQLCFGYQMAKEFALLELQSHCQKQINEKKRDVLESQSFQCIGSEVLHDILGDLVLQQTEEIRMVWNACLNWSKVQCVKLSMDTSDLSKHRELLGKCFDQMLSIVSKDNDFLIHVMENYKGLFQSDDLSKTQFTNSTNNNVNNQHEIKVFKFVRLSEPMLSTQICSTTDQIFIEFQSTKKIALTGIGFATIIGVPKGELSVLVGTDSEQVLLFKQPIISKAKRREPSNFVQLSEPSILESEKSYFIKVELSKDLVYYRNRSTLDVYQTNDFVVKIKAHSRRDIFSHLFFSSLENN